MPLRVHNFNYIRIEFRDDNQKKKKRFEALVKHDILSTRYADESWLRALGLFDFVKWMFDRI